MAGLRWTCFAVFVVMSSCVLSGCTGVMHTATGDTMSSYNRMHLVPYLLSTGDTDAACRTGASFGNLVASFERVTDRPNVSAMMASMSAGMCAETEAWDAELDAIRALRAGRADDTQDARLRQERKHLLAAIRFGEAWKRANLAFGELGGETCPQLEEADKVMFLLGVASGMLAVMHDTGAGRTAGISMSIPMRVARASKCLDNKTWWGMPGALAGAVWLAVPGAAPKGADPIAHIEKSAQLSEAAGVRLARALQIETLRGAGKTKEMRAAIVALAASLRSKPSARRWRLLDTYAAQIGRHASDRVWCTEKGYRAPTDDFGELPASTQAEDDEDDDAFGDDSE